MSGLDTPDKTARSTDWRTPPRVLDPARAYFGRGREAGRIPADPASTPDNATGAAIWCAGAELPGEGDGLAIDWRALCDEAARRIGYGGIFLNPPYGEGIRDWTAKVREESARGIEIVALLPCGARFSTSYWQDDILSARLDAVTFVRGRVAFIDPATGERADGNIYDSAIYGYNVDPGAWHRTIGRLGKTIHGRVWA